MASRKRIYDAEFREGAVRIVTETGKPIPEVADDLGISSRDAAQLGVAGAAKRVAVVGPAGGRAIARWSAAGE